MGCCYQDSFKTDVAPLCGSYLAFSSSVFLKSNHIAATWKNSCFISSDRLDFNVIDNVFIAIYAFPIRIFSSISVNEILLPRYVKWLASFIGLPFHMEISPFCLKHMDSVVFKFASKPMLLATCNRLCNRDSS